MAAKLFNVFSRVYSFREKFFMLLGAWDYINHSKCNFEGIRIFVKELY